MSLLLEALQALGVKCKPGAESAESIRLRVGGFDRRKEMFKGWVEVEPFSYRGSEGSFCVMQRDQVWLSTELESTTTILICCHRGIRSRGVSCGRRW